MTVSAAAEQRLQRVSVRDEIGRRIALHQAAGAAHQREAALHVYGARLADVAGDAEAAGRQRGLADEEQAAAAAEYRLAIAASRSVDHAA